jgi:prolipoprotein diacylglyceryltransferase
MYPILFKIGSIYIHSRETFLLLAFIVGMLIAMRRAFSVGISQRIIIKLTICIFFSSLIGARLFYAIENL